MTGQRTLVLSRSDRVSRWMAAAAALAIAGLYLSLPERLTLGPSWAVAFATALLLVPAIVAQRMDRGGVNFVIGVVLLSILTAAVVWSLGALIAGIPDRREPPRALLHSAVTLWISNVLLFASWYWRLDGGGPHRREKRSGHRVGAFLFPQMTLPEDSELRQANWKPAYVDYLFLAFNTSTAFSPTDVPVMRPWAKSLMMLQSSISLAAIAILAARAINIL